MDYKTGGAACKVFTPTKRGGGGGAEKVLAMLKGGGHSKFCGSYYMVA